LDPAVFLWVWLRPPTKRFPLPVGGDSSFTVRPFESFGDRGFFFTLPSTLWSLFSPPRICFLSSTLTPRHIPSLHLLSLPERKRARRPSCPLLALLGQVRFIKQSGRFSPCVSPCPFGSPPISLDFLLPFGPKRPRATTSVFEVLRSSSPPVSSPLVMEESSSVSSPFF